MEIGNWKLSYWAIAFSLSSASALLRFWSLSQTPFANGWDSYFYLVQLKSLEETGQMHSPEASLIYPYLRFFYWLTGDYVVALKTGTAVLCGAFTAVVFWMAQGRGKNGSLALPLAAWFVFSPHLTYFAAQYPKNLLGTVLLAWLISFLSKPESGSKVYRATAIVILLAANYFAHRLTFGLAAIYLGFWLFFQLKKDFFNTVFSRKNLLLAGIALGVFVAAGQIFPGLFHLADFGRLQGVLSWKPQFAPYSFVSQFGVERISGWWLAEVGLVAGYWLLVVGYWLLKTRKPSSQIPLLCLSSLLLFPFLEWSFTGIAWRSFLVFGLLTPLLVIDCQFVESKRSGLVFVVVFLCCSFFSWKSYDPQIHDPNYQRFATVTEKARRFLENKNPELLIAHNALAEFYTFTASTDAMPWLPEYAVDSSRLWRIAAVENAQTLRYYAGNENENLTLLGWGYFLLPEHVWRTAMQRAKMENDTAFLTEMLDWKNPSRARPVWLLRRKRGF